MKDFPELEDDALNAVYDLCEDPVAKVCPPSMYASSFQCSPNGLCAGPYRGVPGHHTSFERTKEVGQEKRRCFGSVVAERCVKFRTMWHPRSQAQLARPRSQGWLHPDVFISNAKLPDEPDEVLVVKKALTEHLDMDPVVTLGVLCDQIVPLDDAYDEEEQATRHTSRVLEEELQIDLEHGLEQPHVRPLI